MLVVLLSLTVYIWLVLSNVKAEKEQKRYKGQTKQIVLDVTTQLYHYMMVLQGGAGLFAVSEEVTKDEWRMYCKYRQPRIFFPGIQGIGFSRVVLPSELARHIQGIRAEGYPDYTLWPAGERDVYTAIIFLEPFDERNQRAFGYDMFSEPVRRTAMERARDTGKISISGKVTLVQEIDKNVQAGFLMYVPIYAKGMPLNTIEERRAALTGYVYSPFRMNNFLREILPDRLHDIEFTIYDGTKISLADLMYKCDEHPMAPDGKRKPMFSSRQTVDLYGHQWTLAFETRPSFSVALGQFTSWSILASGLVISLLIFFFTRQQEKSHKELDAFAAKLRLTAKVTEEKSEQLEQTLQDAADLGARMDAILTSVADGLVVIDHENKVVLLNPAAEILLGLKFSEIKGKPLHFAIENRTLSGRMRIALEEQEPGYQFDFEISGDQSSRPRILQAKTAKVVKIEAESKNRDKMVVIIRDVTVEQEIDRMKTEFLSTTAHELRTPLTSIQGFSKILISRDNLEPERQKKYLSYINTQAVALGKIINDFLDISHIESGKGFKLHKESFDLGSLIEDIVELFRLRSPDRGFKTNLPKGPVTIFADQNKVLQLMENLLSNSVKYSQAGGKIRVTVRKSEEFEREKAEKNISQPSSILISVEDEGVGMTADQVKQVFDKFWRADASSKAIEGTGLGMSIVKYIVAAHNGTVWVESELGKGTTVRIEIPRN